uniref:Uncharacterized protein n=1 Tax=viral metagenome TaxID=1070528 RepID=A0A6H1ZLL4_9ZZZZ
METCKDGLEECLEIVKSLDIKELEFAMWLSGHDRDTIEQLYKDFYGGVKPQVMQKIAEIKKETNTKSDLFI